MSFVSCTNIKTLPTAWKSRYKNRNFAEMDKQFGYEDIILISTIEQTLI